MAFEIREKNGKFYVVDTADNNKIRGSYDSESAAEDRADDLSFRAEVRDKLSRVPVTEMTAEEKAAAYDKMIADQKNTAKTDPTIPPKNEPPVKEPKKRSGYWGDLADD